MTVQSQPLNPPQDKEPEKPRAVSAPPCPVCRKEVPDTFWHRKKFQCPYCGFMPG